MLTKLNLSEIAMKVAIDAKAGGFEKDMGCLYDDDWNLTDAEWHEVCDQAEALLPTVKVPASVYAAWAQADRDVRAEQRSEAIAFGSDGYHTHAY